MKKDIQNRNDVELLVKTFYNKVRSDELLAPKFAHLVIDDHLPVMYKFWSSILLDEHSYTGNAFEKHINLGINAEHFKRWLFLFETTVDDLFKGDKAELAKQRANNIAYIFQSKLI